MRKVLLLLLVTFSCWAESVGKDERAFALSLYSKVKTEEGNTAVSPYGIFSNLSLLYFGAREETATQFRSALNITGTDDRFKELFEKQEVKVTIPEEDMPGRPTRRIKCEKCGEHVQDSRDVDVEGRLICRACAGEAYYKLL